MELSPPPQSNSTLEGDGRNKGYVFNSIFISSHNLYQNTSSKTYLQFLSFSCSNHSPFTDQPLTVLLRLLESLLSPEAETTYQNCPHISPCLNTAPQCPDYLTLTSSGQRDLLPLVTNSWCCNAHLASGFFAIPPCQCHLLAITPGLSKGRYWWATPTLSLLPPETSVLTHY